MEKKDGSFIVISFVTFPNSTSVRYSSVEIHGNMFDEKLFFGMLYGGGIYGSFRTR